MRRKVIMFVIIIICFLLQTTVFQAISFAGIVPNILIVLVSSYGFMNGRKSGMYVGFFCGLLVDIFFGFYLGIYALIYMYIGYINGIFQKRFYPDDIKLPMLLISASDLVFNFAVYFLMFFLRGKFQFMYYLNAIIIPEFVYTMVITVFLYFILLKINQALESSGKRRAVKVDL